MTWYPRKNLGVSTDTRETFEQAKKAKKVIPNIVDCPVCHGAGKKQDAKSLKIRDCTICKGLGKVKNPKFKFQHA